MRQRIEEARAYLAGREMSRIIVKMQGGFWSGNANRNDSVRRLSGNVVNLDQADTRGARLALHNCGVGAGREVRQNGGFP